MPEGEEAKKDEKLLEEGAEEPLLSEQGEEEKEVKDRLLRLAAEFDNYKKRVAKEIIEAKNVGKAEALIKIPATIDEFELAIAAQGKDGGKGVEMVFQNFMNTLKGMGLKEVETAGTFDPYKHEIMLVKESPEKEGTILQVVRKGYMLNGIMLRPASVIVSKAAAENKEEKKDEEEKKE